MKRWLLDNLVWKLLSVAIAAILWVAVAREPEFATSVSVPILFRNVPDDLDLGSDVPDRVHLEVRGPSGRLTATSLGQAAVVLNLADLQPGERTFTIRDNNIRGLPIGVVFYRAVPSQVSLRFEHLMTKLVPIEPVYAAPPADGYEIVKFSVDPPKAEIMGPEDNVREVDHVTTDPIDLADVVSHSEKRVHLRLGDPQVRMKSRSMVKFTVDLRKKDKDFQ